MNNSGNSDADSVGTEYLKHTEFEKGEREAGQQADWTLDGSHRKCPGSQWCEPGLATKLGRTSTCVPRT